jgi:DNA-binding FadR family transcriptional regulator
MPSRRDRELSSTRIPLVDEIASVIRERIYTHRYPTGSWLRQEHLSAELGVSRTPLREALRVLEQEGLVQVEAGQGARVVTGDLDKLLDAYELRAVVDGLAARLAAERPHREQIRHLRRTIEVQRAAPSIRGSRASTPSPTWPSTSRSRACPATSSKRPRRHGVAPNDDTARHGVGAYNGCHGAGRFAGSS